MVGDLLDEHVPGIGDDDAGLRRRVDIHHVYADTP